LCSTPSGRTSRTLKTRVTANQGNQTGRIWAASRFFTFGSFLIDGAAQIFAFLFQRQELWYWFWPKTRWAAFWVIFFKKLVLVTLLKNL
jgi:hypothetical protein